jgi:hypothetical protein
MAALEAAIQSSRSGLPSYECSQSINHLWLSGRPFSYQKDLWLSHPDRWVSPRLDVNTGALF